MLTQLHKSGKVQLFLGFIIGIFFGFLLQKGGVCRYEIIMKQLLLEDFTVVKVMLTAVVTGMVGIYAMRDAGWVILHKQPGSLGSSIPGPLLFGVGFALLGYCPGTSVGAVGHGALDALIGISGMVLGSALFATMYPSLKKRVLSYGYFGDKTLIDIIPLRNHWPVIIGVAAIIIAFLLFLETAGR